MDDIEKAMCRQMLNSLATRARQTAVEHGFKDASFGEEIALIHSELSEALEDFREGRKLDEVHYESTQIGRKPCGVPSELADVLIRVFDVCGKYGIDIGAITLEKMAYNDKRPYRHGGKTL